jgi:TolB-like protein/class 3 adenylate cyclase
LSETRKIAAILVVDVVGYSRLAGADEDRTLSRLRGLRSDLIDPAVAAHHGRIVKRTGDGSLIEFRSVVDAVRCAIEVQNGMAERNAGVSPDKRIEFRVGVHLGDVVEEADGDLMGDGVNIAARLEGICAPGAICLSEDAYRQVKGRLDLAVIDLGPTQLKNIADPIRVYALEVGKPAQAKSAPAPTPEKSAPPHLSIVVLPFANIGGGPEQDYFVDGVTESLTTDLSRINGSFVIGRHTAFSYKGKAIDLKKIGRELGVRYALEGSILRSGERMRINAQLVDAETSAHIWADRFDKPVADLFATQDEIVAHLASQLNAALVSAEARRAERSPHPDSMDFYFRGKACLNKGYDPAELARAQTLFSEALTIDPENVDALVWTAFVDVLLAVTNFNAEKGAARLGAGERNAAKALSLAPNHAQAHAVLGLVMGVTNRAERAMAECRHALELDPNFAHAHGWMGLHALHLGRAEETEGHIREALRLSPFDAFAFGWFAIAGYSKNSLGRYEEAVDWLRQGVSRNSNFAMPHFHLGSALAHLGRMDEARAAAQAGLALDPTFNLASFRAAQITDDPYYLAWRERVIEGMRKAGVADG